jgi:hypothetical protein
MGTNYNLKIRIIKEIRIFILFFLVTLSSIHIYAQPNTLCSGADPFCTGTSYNFPTNVNAPDAQAGPDYGCLCAQPNPVWYYLKIATAGNLSISIVSSCGDVDYAAWGPFPNLTCSNSDLTTSGSYVYEDDGSSSSCDVDALLYSSGNMVDCSYDIAASEVLYIPNALVGQYYMVMITNYANCSGNITFNQTGGTGATDCSIMAPPISNNGPLCVGQTLLLTVSNPVTGAIYHWTGPNGFTSTTMNPTITNVTAANAGVYSLVITVGGVNSPAVTTTVVINPNPVITATASPTAICNGASTSLSASSTVTGTTFAWMPGSLSGSTVTVSPTTATTYTVTGTSAAGCTGSTTVSVTVNPLPTVSATASPPAICNGASSSLTASSTIAGTTFAWMPGSLSGSTVTVSPTTTTTYTVTGTTSSSCSGSTTVTVTVNPLPTVSATASPAAICNGASSSLTASSTVT